MLSEPKEVRQSKEVSSAINVKYIPSSTSTSELTYTIVNKRTKIAQSNSEHKKQQTPSHLQKSAEKKANSGVQHLPGS